MIMNIEGVSIVGMNSVNDYEQRKTVDEQEEEEHQWKKEVDYKQLNIGYDEYIILTFGVSSIGSEQNRYELFRVSRTSINRVGIRTVWGEYKLEELWG